MAAKVLRGTLFVVRLSTAAALLSACGGADTPQQHGLLGVVTSAVNVPAMPSEDMEVLGPFVPLCRSLGRIGVALAQGSSIDRVQTEFLGRIAERDTRLLLIQVLMGVLQGFQRPKRP